MCELFGVTAKRKIRINGLLETFFSHSMEHKDGWGLSLFDQDRFSIHKEPVRAIDSPHLKNLLEGNLETSRCIAHIRQASIGEVCEKNTHPFSRYDDSGRRWVLAHNGNIFDSKVLSPYQYLQEGSTDSERILLYIVDEINKHCRSRWLPLSRKTRIHIVDDAIKAIVPGNKVNLIIYDGDLFYIHENEAGTLFEKDGDNSAVFSTTPLEPEGWHEVPQNRLLVYRKGKPVYTGCKHDWTYVHNKKNMNLLYLAYSEL